MEIRQLQHFLAVIKYGGFSRAAQNLNMSQPGLTKSVQRLEERLNVRLFVRGARRLQLTEYGEILEPHARVIDIELRDALNELKSRRNNTTGDIIIGAGPIWAKKYLPEAIVHIHRSRPNIRFKLAVGEPDTLIESLKLGMLDVVFSGFLGILGDSLTTIPLIESQEGLIVREGHPLCQLQPCSIKDVLGYGWAIYSGEKRKKIINENIFLDLGYQMPSPTIETDSFEQLLTFLESTDLVSILPQEIIDQKSGTRRLVLLECQELQRNRQAGAILRSNSGGSAAVRTLICEVRNACASYGYVIAPSQSDETA